MKKSSAISLLAVVLSLVFCVLYFGLFARISETGSAPEDKTEVAVIPSAEPSVNPDGTQSVSQGSNTLTWIQAGAFARESSLNELMHFLSQDGFSPVSYPKGDLQMVAVGYSLNPEETAAVKQKLIELDYEWMEKSAVLSAEQKQQFEQGQVREVLEGCTSQP